jgi:transcriptional regulator with XRE-family HTH domain
MNDIEFSEWLQSEIQQRDWSAIDLSKVAKSDASYIYRVINKERSPGNDFCRAIAQAFSIPEQEVFIRAGLMTRPKDYDPNTARLAHNIANLSDEERRIIETMINSLNHKKEPAKKAGLIVK